MSSLFVTASQENSGKSAISLAVFQQLAKHTKKIAVFWPVIAKTEDGGKDPFVSSVINALGLKQSYEDSFAYTLCEARDLINKKENDLVIETILSKFKKLEAENDFVLCIGSDYTSSNQAFEFELNTEIAAALCAPVMYVANVEKKCTRGVISNIETSVVMFRERFLDVVAVVANKSSHSADELKTIKDAFASCGCSCAPLLFVVPASSATDCCALCKGDSAALNAAFGLFGDCSTFDGFASSLINRKSTRISPKMFEFGLIEKAKSQKMRIVLPEGIDERILRAADDLLRRDVADLVVLGDKTKIADDCKKFGLNLSKATIIHPATAPNFEEFAETYAELRKAKGITIEQARTTMSDPTYYGTMMVYKGTADGMVSGAINTTAHTIRPAFEIIKTRAKGATVSSAFFMCLKDRVLVFGDCAVLPNPSPQELAHVALNAAELAEVFGVDPKVAMLSYSTGSSGKGEDVDAVVQATAIAKELAPNLPIEGPLQYDAAIDPGVAATKLPNSKVAGKATVFVFPDLNTGNNTYKAVQRAANALAIGPVLAGLKKPVNDLSRGCTVPDIINTVAITAIQAQAIKNAAN